MVLDLLFSNYSFFIFSYYKDILLKKIQLLNFKVYQLYFEQILMIKNTLILNVIFKSIYSIKYHQLFLLTRGFLKTYTRIFFFWDLLLLISISSHILAVDFLVNFISYNLGNNKRKHYSFLHQLTTIILGLSVCYFFSFSGFFLLVRGKLRGNRRKKVYKYHFGSVSPVLLNRQIRYGLSQSYTRFGVFSIQVLVIIS
jgi:hypothetical protein